MKDIVIKYLNSKGYIINKDYYNIIDILKDWYNDDVSNHTTYRDSFGIERRLNTLGLAKTICEDYASLIYAETDEIKSDIENQNEHIKQMIDNYNFNEIIPNAIEKSCWSGTVASIIKLENILLQNGKFIASNESKKKLVIVDAQNIIPLKIENNEIIDCAFVFETIKDNKKLVYIETHILKGESYEITNIYLDIKTGKEVIVEGIIPSFVINTKTPLFSILKTPKNNPVEDNNGLGFSIFGNALIQLKGCDIAFNNFIKDFELGGKKIIYNKKLITYKTVTYSDGTTKQVPKYPDDIAKQQFMLVGDELDGDSKELIHEYNPSLRVEENIKGIQTSLDLLSFKCGLGKNFYSFEKNGITKKTATEYSGEKQDLIRNCKKFRNNLTKFISNTIKANLFLDRVVFNEKVTEECEIMIDNKDGFLVDDEAVKESARKDLALGVISKVEYRMIVFKETEEVATEMINKIESELLV
jgi:A118 family predicted phage portal protein